ncbi:hypothetical protein Dsin_009327 [Dipteronia sinensis]|uniref:SWIM-type domain-containing protein n=1 Tax=Dipteronia sinensis TaxID=43782 RepID=A0AAE0AQR8_9ROSI|nr:hypothetical protein Dsin_009327 [Dipteronia sinensis]
MFKDKKTLKGALGFNALQTRFDYRVRRLNHTRFVAICKKRDCQWVFRAGKSRNGTYWNVKSIDSEHTCDDNGNYNVDFHRVSSHVIGQLFARKFVDPGRNIRPKDIMTGMKDKHGINLTYNKAYRSKDRALHSVFGDPWESFKTLPAYFHMFEKSNPGTKTKIETDRKNRFKYGFMALGACIEGFNTIIRPVITVDATYLKSKTRGVLLVAVCNDGNEMIYPLAFGFANSECSKSVDMVPEATSRCDLASRTCDDSFGSTHGKRYHMMTTNIAESMNFCLLAIRKLPITSIAEFIRDLLQQRVLASQRCEIHLIDFDRFKVEDQWKEAIVDLEQRSCSCREWDLDELPCIHAMAVQTFKGMPINALCSDFFTTGWLKQAYAMAVNPVPKPEVWDIANDIRTRVVLLWKKKVIDRKTKEKSDAFCWGETKATNVWELWEKGDVVLVVVQSFLKNACIAMGGEKASK